jgi:hypothetical protein
MTKKKPPKRQRDFSIQRNRRGWWQVMTALNWTWRSSRWVQTSSSSQLSFSRVLPCRSVWYKCGVVILFLVGRVYFMGGVLVVSVTLGLALELHNRQFVVMSDDGWRLGATVAWSWRTLSNFVISCW